MDFFIRFKKILIVILFLIIALVFMFVKNDKKTFFHEKLIVFFSAPVQNFFNAVSSSGVNILNKYFFLVGVHDENKILKEENIKIRGINYKLREIEEENKRLREMLNFKKEAVDLELIAAEVVSIDTRPDYKTIRINKGTADNVSEQMPVVTSEGIVGQVFKAYRFYSDVLLITDRFSSIDGIIERLRSRGVISGNIESCIYKYVLRGDNIELGDLIISSGLDQVFPKGLPIGLVSNVKKEKFGIMQDVVINPIVDFSKLEEVFVVIKNNQKNIEKDTGKIK